MSEKEREREKKKTGERERGRNRAVPSDMRGSQPHSGAGTVLNTNTKHTKTQTYKHRERTVAPH